MAFPDLTLQDVSSVKLKLESEECDYIFLQYVRQIAFSIGLSGQGWCCFVRIRPHGTPADLLVNGFLLGPQDHIVIAESCVAGWDLAPLMTAVVAYRRAACRLARELKPDSKEVHHLQQMLQCAFWVTKADVLMQAFQRRVPMLETHQNVRPRPRVLSIAAVCCAPMSRAECLGWPVSNHQCGTSHVRDCG